MQSQTLRKQRTLLECYSQVDHNLWLSSILKKAFHLIQKIIIFLLVLMPMMKMMMKKMVMQQVVGMVEVMSKFCRI